MNTTGVVAPMFPLGSVLLPHMLLPLNVFEPRYRVMFEELVGELPRPDDQVTSDSEPRFGVALIERGSEIGGGEVRSKVATLATVLGAQLLEDGRWGVVALGGERGSTSGWRTIPTQGPGCGAGRIWTRPTPQPSWPVRFPGCGRSTLC